MLEYYRRAGLVPLLDAIRAPRRYAGMNGVNVLTNAAPDESDNRDEVVRELRRAEDAGRNGNHAFATEFTHPKQGLSYGLNPYTDWSLAQLAATPSHYYLFLGLDWYAISGLGNADDWFRYLQDPFRDARDRYWHNLWAWIMLRHEVAPTGRRVWQTPIREQEAAEFIRLDGGGFIFHNRIPYLRPAGFENSGTDWYRAEWRQPSVRKDAEDDLRILREQTGGQVVAICTGQDSVRALLSAGFEGRRIVCWGAHPSQVFHPATFVREEFWFRGKAYFEC